MPQIQLDKVTLSHRENQIRKMLRPLVLHSSNPACKVQSQIGGIMLFGAYDGSYQGGSARDWRFMTSTSGIFANYHERWISISGASSFLCLTQAYLTLYQRVTPTDENELLALHCDPEEPSNSAYKRGPHLHFTIAGAPLKDAHIALTRGHLDEVLSCSDNLIEALTWCIVMIKDEVLSRY